MKKEKENVMNSAMALLKIIEVVYNALEYEIFSLT